MSIRVFPLVLAVALVASACGSEPETVVVGAANDEPAAVSEVDDVSSDDVGEEASADGVDEAPAVAEDSAPALVIEPCDIIGSGGPLDPADVLINVAGGRWGDDVMTVDSGSVEYDFEEKPFTVEPCHPKTLLEDCTSFFAFFDDLVDEFRATGRDDDRDHELDNYAGDVGIGAEAYVDAFDVWVAECPTIDVGGDVAQLARLELDQVSAAEVTVDTQRVWIAVAARENVFSMLVIQQTDEDMLTQADLEDFERLVGIWQTRMESAPLS